MPTTGAALTLTERAAFGAWLEARRVRAGRSKNHVLRKAGIPIERFNSYVEGGVIPGAATLARIAEALDIPWPIAFWRAGHFRDLLGAINLLSLALHESSSSGIPLQKRRIGAVALVDLALRAFPRRDYRTNALFLADLIDERDAALRLLAGTITFDEALPRRMHPKLERAAKALDDNAMPLALRRVVAGEYVNAWADEFDEAAALAVRAGLVSPTSQMARLILDDQPKGA